MKIEKLRQNKIKILIDHDDLIRWGISAENVLKNAPESRGMFVEILKKAEKETGFNCNNSKLVIESAINSEEKILTLYVTKVASEEENALFNKISCQRKAEVINPKMMYNIEDNFVMVAFKSFEDIVEMCNALNAFHGGVLYTYRDTYYIDAPESLSIQMSEFGEVCRESLRAIVREHGKTIIGENAFLIIREKL